MIPYSKIDIIVEKNENVIGHQDKTFQFLDCHLTNNCEFDSFVKKYECNTVHHNAACDFYSQKQRKN